MGIDHCDLDRYNLLVIRCLFTIKTHGDQRKFSADSVVYHMGEKSSTIFVRFQTESGNVNSFRNFFKLNKIIYEICENGVASRLGRAH